MSNDSLERQRAEQKARLITFLQKIPLFSDLPASMLRKILAVSSKIVVNEGQLLCKKGEQSNAMYILLSGRLAVKMGDSAPVATIEPINCIGEMGVFTGEPRTAYVQAMQKSAMLMLSRNDLNALIRRNTDFGVKIMSKVIKILADRIGADNERMQEMQDYIVSIEQKSL